MNWGLVRGISPAISSFLFRTWAAPITARSPRSVQSLTAPLLVHRQRSSQCGDRGDAFSGWHGTTILAVRRGKKVTVIGDGQVTMGSVVVKPNARKVRRLGPDGEVIAGFAGATADAMTLFERLESKIEEYPGQLLRSCVSLAKDWRMDKYLRRLDAMLLVCDNDISLYLSGTGDVLEPTDGVIGIGSGGSYAIAAARALIGVTELGTEEIAKRSMTIAADMCVYTNGSFVIENLNPGSPRNAQKENGPLSPNSHNVTAHDGRGHKRPADGIKENGLHRTPANGKSPKANGSPPVWHVVPSSWKDEQDLHGERKRTLAYSC